jgi:hypothetical protein
MAVSPQRDDSKSRSRSREPAAHATGRGGVGNLFLGGPSEKVIEEQDEAERALHSHEPGMYVSLFCLSPANASHAIFSFFQALGQPWRLWQSHCERGAVLQGWGEPARREPSARDSFSRRRDRRPRRFWKFCFDHGLMGIYP